jgi:hypothetical protein
MGWHVKRHTSKKHNYYRTLQNKASAKYGFSRLISRLSTLILYNEKIDPSLKQLQKQLNNFNIHRHFRQLQPIKPEQLVKYDFRAGRTTSYYDAEAEALAADLEYVVRTENRRLLETELDKARREVARRTCRSFAPLMALPEEQRNAVLFALGLGPGILEDAEYRPVELPTRPAGRWKVVVHEPKRGDDDWEPDREVAGILEEEISRGMEDSGNRLRAAEMGQKGQKLLITYGSSGGGD